MPVFVYVTSKFNLPLKNEHSIRAGNSLSAHIACIMQRQEGLQAELCKRDRATRDNSSTKHTRIFWTLQCV